MTQNDLKGFRFRESTRAPFETEVKLRFDRFGGAVSGFSADISMEGMFVRTGEPKPVGTLVQFEFSLGQDGELIQGLGDVVWVRTRQLAPDKPPGMGIQFRYIDPHSRELIVKIVDRYLKDAKDEGGAAPGESTLPPQQAAAIPPPGQEGPPFPPPAAGPEPAAIPSSSPAAANRPAQPTADPSPLPAAAPAARERAASSPPAGTGTPAEGAPRPGGSAGLPPMPAQEASAAQGSAGGGELFIPEEAWDPVAAAARAVSEPSFPVAEPSPRPAFSGSAGVARQSSSRRWLLPALLVIVAVLAGAGFAFRDRLLTLLPGGGGTSAVTSFEPLPEAVTEPPPSEPVPPGPERENLEPSAAGAVDRPSDEAAALPNEPRESSPSPIVSPPPQSAQAEGPLTIVEEIRSWQRAGETVVTIEGNGVLREGGFSELRLEKPPRVLIKLFGVQEAYQPLTAVGSPELRQIRTALHAGDELHIVLDLASADVQASLAIESGRLRIRLGR